ncbi:MAG: hypothetical protein ACFCBU_10145 [Cyanophyceae cyanobacterium]
MAEPKRGTDDKPQENFHAAVSRKDCRRMGKRNNWDLKRTESSGDPILKVWCVFKGPQTTFEDQTYDN